ncbi:MAG TPA: phosphatase PAP2 family protein [Vicinamibacteria bacterium]|nr:phosphatase PAP2 family protein [Vicinamibacteria bacterium]
MSPVVFVTHSDDWVSERMRRFAPPRWLAAWMLLSTRLGDGWVWAAVVLAVTARGEGVARALTETATAIVVVNVTQMGLKHAFRRTRPLRASAGVIVTAPDRFSFPSGHTMNAFAVAVIVSIAAPHAAVPALALAGSVGASRVVFRLHYVSDVVAGAAVGSVLAALMSSFGVV